MNPEPESVQAAITSAPTLLWEDSERSFYRIWRRGEEAVPVERIGVRARAGRSTAAVVARLAHEYGLRDCLDVACALMPVELLHERGQTTLVLEAHDAVPLDRVTAQGLSLPQALEVAVAMAVAVARLHDLGIVHKDLKPANFVIAPNGATAWLTGFGIAMRAPGPAASADAPEIAAGTPAYMAPEQSGRMTRSVDFRSDLYSLGVVLYQLFCGLLPFSATEPGELFHSHIARKPLSLREQAATIPAPLSDIVMKLLEKAPEDRYQTAAGLAWDLRRCAQACAAGGPADAFELGEHDRAHRIAIFARLYGRDGETDRLLEAFGRVEKNGSARLAFVRGGAGIGKSALVLEMQRKLAPDGSLFASGKFDQLRQDVPFAALVQALRGLVRALLGVSEDELAQWRGAIDRALEPNGALAIDLIPELAHVIGHQAPVTALPALEAKARLQLLLRRLIGVFATPERPLVLFLDDLQWIDVATLDLLEELMRFSEVRHLLLVGAYRDAEVDARHPLTAKLEAMRLRGFIDSEIVLQPLREDALADMLADSLSCAPERCLSLGRLVADKTGGNPFFANHFIQELARQASFDFDTQTGEWRWDLQRIQAMDCTDNVGALMAEKLERLSPETRRALRELSSLGNSVSAALLARLRKTTAEELHAVLAEAQRADLIVHAQGTYRFAHDRIQEAAYSLTEVDTKAQEHLRLGRLLKEHFGTDGFDDHVFAIVGQLNRGTEYMSSLPEREQLAELNLMAARRAKGAAAFDVALSYLVAGSALLPPDAPQRRHELVFELELHRAECEYMGGAAPVAVERLVRLLATARTTEERCAATCLLTEIYWVQAQPELGVEACLSCLRTAGLELPMHPTDAQVRTAYEAVWARLGDRAIEDVLEMPVGTDPAARATLEVIAKLAPCAAGRNLYMLTACIGAEFSLAHGNFDVSCYSYAFFGATTRSYFDDFDAGLRFAQLGYALIERRNFRRFESIVRLSFANGVMAWAKHIRTSCELNRETIEIATKAGDRFSAGITSMQLVAGLLVAGEPLAAVERVVESNAAFATAAGYVTNADVARVQAAFIRTLCGRTRRFGVLDDDEFDEAGMEAQFAQQADAHPLFECFYLIRKLQARYLAGCPLEALEASRRAAAKLWGCVGLIELAEFEFYTALAHCAACDSSTGEDHAGHLESAGGHLRQLQEWALQCPENSENRALLVAAEIARIERRDADAMPLYESAIRSAQASAFIHNVALASELAANFYVARGFDRIAQATLEASREAYRQWGAEGKVLQLDSRRTSGMANAPQGGPGGIVEAAQAHLDLDTVVGVLQAVSRESDLDELVEVIMRLCLEHAGAQRAMLVLPDGDGYRVEAEAVVDHDSIAVASISVPVSADKLPLSILQYVLRTRESVLLHDALREHAFSADAYLRQARSRSVLCTPLLKQSRLAGVIYVENNLAPGAFTPARMALLKLLVSEAAISIENARLYRAVHERERQSRLIVDTIPGLVATLGPNGELSGANIQLVQFCGRSLGEIQQWLTNETIHPQDVSRVSSVCFRAFETGEPYDLEARVRRFDGVYRWFQCRGRPLRNALGHVVSWYVLLSDIDDLKAAEAGLRDAERRQLEDRLNERERIARALHDTLLQSAQGFILSVGAAANRMAQADPVRQKLEEALLQGQAVIVESRDRIQDLRAVALAPAELSVSLAAVGRGLAGEDQGRFRCSVEGRVRSLGVCVADEAFQIGREAIINAFAHSGATAIELTVSYHDDRLALLLSDNGRGIHPDVLDNGGSPGHWGMPGMRERADHLSGHLEVRSELSAGTQVELLVPAHVAYRA